jgi:hypothetical protein
LLSSGRKTLLPRRKGEGAASYRHCGAYSARPDFRLQREQRSLPHGSADEATPEDGLYPDTQVFQVLPIRDSIQQDSYTHTMPGKLPQIFYAVR